MKQAIFLFLLLFGIQNTTIAAVNIPDAIQRANTEMPKVQKHINNKKIKAKLFNK
jgi:hypothetical protein